MAEKALDDVLGHAFVDQPGPEGVPELVRGDSHGPAGTVVKADAGAGAGRDGGLTDSAWGIEQAQDAISGTTSHGFSYKYIFFDAEPNGGSGSLDNGWTTNWTTTCGTSSNGSVASADNVNVFNSWWDYFSGHTQYMPGAYSSPAQGPNSWSAYFGSKQLLNTPEWMYDYEATQTFDSTFPTGWSISGTGVQAAPFAGAPAHCEFAWQWIGGDTQSPDGARLDQIDLNDNSCV
jgi:hypothetical protein